MTQFTNTLLVCCSTEVACDSLPPNIVLRIASDQPRALAKQLVVYCQYLSTSKPAGVKHDAIDNCGGGNAGLPVDENGAADSWRGGNSILLI